jgi:hypothetical protein
VTWETPPDDTSEPEHTSAPADSDDSPFEPFETEELQESDDSPFNPYDTQDFYGSQGPLDRSFPAREGRENPPPRPDRGRREKRD